MEDSSNISANPNPTTDATGTIGLLNLPHELLEEILILCDPVDVAQVAQTCKRLHGAVYNDFGGSRKAFWRTLYLSQPLDDPRACLSWLGVPRVGGSVGSGGEDGGGEIDWRGELQGIIRARAVVTNVRLCKGEGELREVLGVFLGLAEWVPPLRMRESLHDLSKNLLWVPAVLRDFLDIVERGVGERGVGERKEEERVWIVPPKEMWEEETIQLHAHLHTLFGITRRDVLKRARVRSRGFVYDMRNYDVDNEYGPLRSDGRVNWVHLQAIHHAISMHLVEPMGLLEAGGEGEGAMGDFEYAIFPMSMPFTQILVPRRDEEAISVRDASGEGRRAVPEGADWALVEGCWSICFCYCDHRELIVYNDTAIGDGPLDMAMFEQDDFEEDFVRIDVNLHVTRVEHDPEHPGRPVIGFVGAMQGPSTSAMHGCVRLTPDNYPKWQFFSGEAGGDAIWSSLGIQIGGVGSSFGVLGAWTTVLHDQDDPVGPFWMQRVQ